MVTHTIIHQDSTVANQLTATSNMSLLIQQDFLSSFNNLIKNNIFIFPFNMTINCKPETVNLDQKLLNYFQNLKTEAIIFKITSKLQKKSLFEKNICLS